MVNQIFKRLATARVGVAVLLFGCNGGTGLDDSFQSVIGEACQAETSVVTRQGNDARVVLRRTRRTTRTVTDSRGFVREQTVLSCQQIECVFQGGAGRTDEELIRLCDS